MPLLHSSIRHSVMFRPVFIQPKSVMMPVRVMHHRRDLVGICGAALNLQFSVVDVVSLVFCIRSLVFPQELHQK